MQLFLTSSVIFRAVEKHIFPVFVNFVDEILEVKIKGYQSIDLDCADKAGL